MSLFRGALVCFFVTVPVLVQSQTFEKITLEPVRSAGPRAMRLQILPDGKLIGTNVLVIDLISYAYDVPSNPSPRLNSLPDWSYGERYDIQATASRALIATTSQEGETQFQGKQMIRRLLGDRFGLQMRVNRKRMRAYALTVSSGGPRLQHSAITAKDCIFDTAPGGCHAFVIGFGHPLNGNAINMDDLASYIENWTDLPPVNRTNLNGLFAVRTEGWLPMRLPPPPPNGGGRVDFSSLPTLFTVLGRLGLELHRQEQVLPVYTIEHIERPAIKPARQQ